MAATFSVVMPTRNRASLAVAQVERLQAMRSAPDEIIVIDDGSSDDTVAQLEVLVTPPLILGGRAEGVSAARNLGIEKVTSEWTVFVDDDDVPFDNWMERLRGLVEDNHDAVYVSVGLDSGDGTPLPVPTVGAAFHHAGCNFMPGSFAVRTSTLREVGGFDDRIRFGEFTDLALRLFDCSHAHGWQLVHDPRPAHRITVRPPAERSSVQSEVFISSALVSIEKNERLWARDPESWALQIEIMAVAMVKAGRAGEGRAALWRAFRIAPSPKRLARVALSSVGPVRRRVWG